MTLPTVLVLSGIGIPPYSARGLTQTLEPIGQAQQLRRTVNGALRDVSSPLFRKFVSVISGDDQQPPAFDATWPGRLVTVDCIKELALAGTHEESTEPSTEDPFDRLPVPGSVRHADGFTFYRPRLVMRVVAWQGSIDEWRVGEQWSLTLEEV